MNAPRSTPSGKGGGYAGAVGGERDLADLAVVIVNYETREHLRACLEAVLPQRPAEVVVVDNASSDGSAALVRERFPGVRLVANTENPGFGAAANQGLAVAGPPHVLVLNADTRPLPGALAALDAALARRPSAALIGPRLIDPDGTHHPSCFPPLTPFNLLVLNTQLRNVARLLPGLRHRFLPALRHVVPREVSWVKGAAIALRRSAAVAVGGFDDGFFLYAEDVDLCFRLRAAGWDLDYCDEAVVVHEGGASTMRDRAASLIQERDSLRRLYRRHSPRALPQFERVMRIILCEHLLRDAARRLWTLNPERRRRLAGDLVTWRRMLAEPPAS